jgi:hypothetical protein
LMFLFFFLWFWVLLLLIFMLKQNPQIILSLYYFGKN